MASKPKSKSEAAPKAKIDAVDPNPILKATDQDWADGWAKALAPNESFWRKHAKASAKPQLLQESAVNGIAMAEHLLAVLGTGTWPTLDECIPAGSILDVVDKFFYEKTSLARELPFYTVIHYVSSLMLQEGVVIQKSEEQVIYPDLWTAVLATSAAGKSLTISAIKKALGGKVKMFPDAKSFPKFFENLKDHNKTFYLKDEFAKLIIAINKDPKMEGLQGCLLEVYSNSPISYSTKASTQTIETPALSILGLSQIANIKSTITKSMIEDGFAQRFGYAFAEKDGRKRVVDIVLDGLTAKVAPLWAELTDTPFHPVYYVDEAVSNTFSTGGGIIMDHGDEVGVREEFSRRVIFRSFKYALVYHVLTGKKDQYLHAEDMANGLRLCARELRDTARLLGMFGILDFPESAPTSPAEAAAVTRAIQPVAINKKNPIRGQPLTYEQCVEKSKGKIRDFAAKGKKATTSSLGAYVKIEVSVLSKILTELAQDPTLAPHIVLPKA